MENGERGRITIPMPKHQPGVGDKNVLMLMGDQRTEALRCNGVVRRRSLSRLDRVKQCHAHACPTRAHVPIRFQMPINNQ
jgi:hypothetical protein